MKLLLGFKTQFRLCVVHCDCTTDWQINNILRVYAGAKRSHSVRTSWHRHYMSFSNAEVNQKVTFTLYMNPDFETFHIQNCVNYDLLPATYLAMRSAWIWSVTRWMKWSIGNA